MGRLIALQHVQPHLKMAGGDGFPDRVAELDRLTKMLERLVDDRLTLRVGRLVHAPLYNERRAQASVFRDPTPACPGLARLRSRPRSPDEQ